MEIVGDVAIKVINGTIEQPVPFSVKNAKTRLFNGFKYFCGQDALWLPEYYSVSEWLEDTQGKGLLMMGANGRGKSVIATKIFPYFFYEQGYGYEIFRACDINRQKEAVCRPKILCIDDIGVEDMANDYGEKINVFAKVMDEVEWKRKLIVLTTNLTQSQLELKYSTRTISRINACCKVVVFNGEDMRKKSILQV